ncbi:MAG: hypothetical protein H7Z12_14930 [Rhodospirillaceae bacterium]|nr:hypothetical protein [Rhodospirillales bacterium]
MGYVHFNLVNSGDCGGMAPAALPGGGFGVAAVPAGLPAAPGTYIIVNTATHNRYVGISGNLFNRFNTGRLPTITEMGFPAATMQNIWVTWGETHVRDTAPALFPGALLVAPTPGFAIVAPAPPAAFTTLIDGVAVNLEQLLIRFVLTQLGAGGTVSNNAMAFAAYVNPTPNPILVQLSWGVIGLFGAGNHQAVWPVGGGGW